MPVFANTGVNIGHSVRDTLSVADGCIVGTHFKVDGITWNDCRRRPRPPFHGRRQHAALTRPKPPCPHVIGLDIGTTSTIGLLIGLGRRRAVTRVAPGDAAPPARGLGRGGPRAVVGQCPARSIERQLLRSWPVTARPRGARGRRGRHGAGRGAARCAGPDPAPQHPAERRALRAEVEELRTPNGTPRRNSCAHHRQRHQPATGGCQAALDFERHEPTVFERIHTVFGSYDYINWKLTGARRVEQNWALEAGFIDLATQQVDDRDWSRWRTSNRPWCHRWRAATR